MTQVMGIVIPRHKTPWYDFPKEQTAPVDYSKSSVPDWLHEGQINCGSEPKKSRKRVNTYSDPLYEEDPYRVGEIEDVEEGADKNN